MRVQFISLAKEIPENARWRWTCLIISPVVLDLMFNKGPGLQWLWKGCFMACKALPAIAKHCTTISWSHDHDLVAWQPVGRYDWSSKRLVIMWLLFAVFSVGFPRKSVGKLSGKVANCSWRELFLVSGSGWKSCLPKGAEFLWQEAEVEVKS